MPVPSIRSLAATASLVAFLLVLATACARAASDAVEAPLQHVEQLLQQSQAAEANEPARAVALAREALAFAEKLPHRSAALRARARLAEALRMTSNYTEARTVIEAGLAQPFADAERADHALLLYELAQIHWNRGNYAAAEQLYVEVQRTAESLGDHRLLIRALNSRGIVARHENHFPDAVEHFRAARALAVAGHETDLRLQIDNNLAVLLTDLHQFDEARTLLESNLAAHTASHNRRSMANALINLGSNAAAAGDEPAALDYYQRALALRLELGVPRHIGSARISVAEALAKLGRPDEALDQLRAAAPVIEKVGSHEFSANLYAAFSHALAARGDFRAALDYHQKADLENESVNGEKTSATVAALREEFDAEKRQREIVELRSTQQQKDAALALQESELLRTRRERYALGAILLLGAIAAAAIIGRQRALARAERRILEETRRARDAAEAAATLKSQLLDLASHDLKAPLIGVMLTADTIADEATDRPALADRARAVHQESQRMFQLVQNLLDGSAAESGELVLHRAPVDLAALARDVVRESEPRAAQKTQRLTFAVMGDATQIDADATRLRQIMHNLVDNALKFSPAGAEIQVTVRGGERVRFEVRDQGPGLTADDQRRLFQRFRRLSAAPTAGEPSSGLGLALARDLVTSHGGRLWAESTPGSGATFIAEFPAPTPTA